MSDEKYKYDVAFSFLAKDESLATQMNDLLQDRLHTFLYSKRQEELAGTDGERTFNAVFSEEARLVVVLYRDAWGESPWTRIEQTAIRNRAFEEGYDFVIFIPLDIPPSVPKWLPRTRLWIGLERWGVNGAATIIEARVQELGGTPAVESVEDRAKRLERSLQFEKKREQFLTSFGGVNSANAAFRVLIDEIERLITIIAQSTSSIKYSLKKIKWQAVILGPHAGLDISWQCKWTNDLTNAKLEVSLWEGHPPFPGISFFPDEKPRRRKSKTFVFDLLKPDTPGWRSSEASGEEYDSKLLAEHILKFYMDDADPKKDGSVYEKRGLDFLELNDDD